MSMSDSIVRFKCLSEECVLVVGFHSPREGFGVLEAWCGEQARTPGDVLKVLQIRKWP